MNHSDRFLTVLPIVEDRTRKAASKLPARLRDEAISEAIAAAFVMTRNVETLTEDIAAAAANFGIRAFLSGRRTGSKARAKDAVFAPGRPVITISEMLLSSGRFNPARIAATRIDFADWLAQLPARSRAIAEALATGDTTGEVAQRFDLSPGRISQIRRMLESNWYAFHGIEV